MKKEPPDYGQLFVRKGESQRAEKVIICYGKM